jgi:hypothetical protein
VLYFKLLPTVHAESLTQCGLIRLTTLKACAQGEDSAGIGRWDPHENSKAVEIRFAIMRGATIDETMAEKWSKEGFKLVTDEFGIAPPSPMWIKMPPAEEYQSGSDMFVYCVSQHQSRRMERRFASGDDSWVEIFDYWGFFNALNTRMIALGHNVRGFGNVQYRSRRFRLCEDRNADPALIKDPVFSAEHESRALWTAHSLPISPISMEVPELTNYCRIQRKVAAFTPWRSSDSKGIK